MNIPFKIKAKLFYYIDKFRLYSFLSFAQRYITKRSGENFDTQSKFWNLHLLSLKKNGIVNRTNPIALEIGAGQSLAQNIFLSNFIKTQVVIDIAKLLNISFTNQAIKYVYKNNPQLIKSELDLQKSFGISYLAPCDVKFLPFSDKTFDAIYTTNTFEHIPQVDIKPLFSFFYKKLKDDGILSLIIDYTDHYSHTDTKIDKFNFRNYSDLEWDKYNFPIHFQNRLNNLDYIDLLNQCGFDVIDNFNLEAGEIIKGEIDQQNYSGGYFICKKK
jgi:hypothetical protein